MPVQKQKSLLGGKAGNRINAAIKKHAADPIDWGMGGLEFPPGILSGQMEVVSCKIEEIPQGKDYAGFPRLIVDAQAISPAYHDDPRTGEKVKIKGKHSFKIVVIADTKAKSSGKQTSLEEHVAEMIQVLKKLTTEDCLPADPTSDEIEDVVQGINDANPPIRFRFTTREGGQQKGPDGKPVVNPQTGKPYPPRTWVDWGEPIQDFEEDEAGSGTVDETHQAHSAAVAAKPNGKASKGDEAAADTVDDLVTLLESASPPAEDEDAQKELKRQAMELGWSEEQVDGADNWAEVVDMIRSGAPTGDEGDVAGDDDAAAAAAAADPEKTPAKGEVWRWRPLDSKGNPLVDAKKKPIDKRVTIETFDPAKETATAKDTASGKILQNPTTKKPLQIPVGHLESV